MLFKHALRVWSCPRPEILGQDSLSMLGRPVSRREHQHAPEVCADARQPPANGSGQVLLLGLVDAVGVGEQLRTCACRERIEHNRRDRRPPPSRNGNLAGPHESARRTLSRGAGPSEGGVHL